ncbi:MAG: AAA family ATPase, partial [Microthrixaceae bacterium]|nr:AAA family ATPase [Microthrixaceae bacterium]
MRPAGRGDPLMWLEALAVDDFGHLHDWELDGLGPGTNVVLGPNESGKTTLLHFISWLLFGFPHGNHQDVRRYRPASGSFGGRIRLGQADADGSPRRWILERHYGEEQPVLSDPDGVTAAPGTLSGLIGSAGLELFRSVFAITTDELAGFETLDTDEVREHIYAAGVVGGSRSARSAIDALRARRRELLGPRSGRIRELHRELERCEESLRAAVAEARELPRLRERVRELAAAVRAADERRSQLTVRRDHLVKLIDTWPLWVEAR